MTGDRPKGAPGPYLLAEIDESDARGSITADPNVIAEVIELTARSIDGVSGLVSPNKTSRRTHSIVDGPEAHTSNSWHEQHGIRVNLDDGVIDADLTISVESGVAIPALAAELQERLKDSAEQLLGFRIGSLAIHIAEIVPPRNNQEGA